MASPLADLDELILRCRDERSRAYLLEAVASYKAGAIRASIVTCWIAVCFDLLGKIRELALSGDLEALSQESELDRIIESTDPKRALLFEKSLLASARDKFELISNIEFLDLERLYEDRNRCAHPSLLRDSEPYSPPAELARVHIFSAVEHLLQHPPVQGKAALGRVLRDIESQYFPTNISEAQTVLSHGPLGRARESLVRNLVLTCLKSLLSGSENADVKTTRVCIALKCVSSMYPGHFDSAMARSVPSLSRELKDDQFLRIAQILGQFVELWSYFGLDTRQRFLTFVSRFPGDRLGNLVFISEYGPIKEAASKRFKSATRQEVVSSTFFRLPKEIRDKIVPFFNQVDSIADAKGLSERVQFHADELEPKQINDLLVSACVNPVLVATRSFADLLSIIRAVGTLPKDEFDAMIFDTAFESLIEKI